MKLFKKFILIFFLLLIYSSITIISYSNTIFSNISNNVFRLHVIANSNSDEDQELKYKVRDGIITYLNSLYKNNNIATKELAIQTAYENTEEIHSIAKNIIIENGFNYDVKINFGNYYFPTKNYGDISFPSGYYDSLKIEIGDAIGQNWWCVLFPSLCFVDVQNGIVPEESKEKLSLSLNSEEYNLISSENTEYKLKFKLVEFFENSKIFISKK